MVLKGHPVCRKCDLTHQMLKKHTARMEQFAEISSEHIVISE